MKESSHFYAKLGCLGRHRDEGTKRFWTQSKLGRDNPIPILDRPTFPICQLLIFYFFFMAQYKLQIYNKELSSHIQGRDYWPYNFIHVTACD